MSYGFKVIAEGGYACFSRPEMKVERVSYDVPPPGALEGMLKSVYWKPAIRYVIDRIIVFNPIDFVNIRRNEVKKKVSYDKVKSQMNGGLDNPIIMVDASMRNQRAAMVLKNVRYGIEFHFELTGLRSEKADEGEEKHANILRCRLSKGKYFRCPCMGCSEFSVEKLIMVDELPLDEISPILINAGEIDLGYMLYRVNFKDGGLPLNGDWDEPIYSDSATAEYYRPKLIGGIIDVQKYRGGVKC